MSQDYELLEATDAFTLTLKVRGALQHGYRVFGGPIGQGGVFCQAVVKEIPKEPNPNIKKMTKGLWDSMMEEST